MRRSGGWRRHSPSMGAPRNGRSLHRLRIPALANDRRVVAIQPELRLVQDGRRTRQSVSLACELPDAEA